MKKNSNIFRIVIGIALIALLNSCKKDIETYIPGDGQEAYVNFYNATEIIHHSGNLDLAKNNMIYVNDSLKNDYFQRQFFKFSDLKFDGRQFPNMHGNWPDVWTGPGQVNGSQVLWQPMPQADFYRFIFTSVNKVFLKDITASLAPKSYTTFYLAESPESDNDYTIVSVPVEPKGIEGRVKIQVVNLSTDWGPIDVVLTDKVGNIVETDLPQNLGFSKYSPYAELDIKYANDYKQLVLKIRQHGSENFTLSTTVDALSESTYAIVVKGFANETTRYIKTSDTENLRVQVAPGLRVHNRSFTN